MWPSGRRAPEIERFEFGYQQRSSFQSEMYHEEVIDLQSPFEHVVQSSANTFVAHVLVLGDQNAGKSTLLHSFTHHSDANFTLLCSQLPFLAASFLNSRFVDETTSPMDELPFLDTDIARATVLFSAQDWSVVLQENCIAWSDAVGSEEASYAYVCLEFVEIGGDHLDRMMRFERGDFGQESEMMRRVCAQSLSLVRDASKLVYIINGATLTSQAAKNVDLTIQSRIEFLRRVVPNAEVLFFVSRAPLEACLVPLQQLAKKCAVDRVRSLRTIDDEGNLNVTGIVEAISELWRGKHFTQQCAEAVGMEQIVAYWKDFSGRLENDAVDVWLSCEGFYKFLSEEEEHEHHQHGPHQHHAARAIPEPNAIKIFDDSARLLSDAGLALLRYGDLTSNIVLHITAVTGNGATECVPLVFAPRRSVEQTHIQMRFPLFVPLFQFVEAQVQHGIPASFWMRPTAEGREAVRRALLELEALLSGGSFNGAADVFLLLMDDWLVGMKRASNEATSHYRFPKRVVLPHADFNSPLFSSTANANVRFDANDGAVHVDVIVQFPNCKYQSRVAPDLMQAYLETSYAFSAQGNQIVLRVGAYNEHAVTLIRSCNGLGGAFITACNPRSKELSAQENDLRMSNLLQRIKAEEIVHIFQGVGSLGKWKEASFFIVCSREKAEMLAREFEQNAIVWIDKREGIPLLVWTI